MPSRIPDYLRPDANEPDKEYIDGSIKFIENNRYLTVATIMAAFRIRTREQFYRHLFDIRSLIIQAVRLQDGRAALQKLFPDRVDILMPPATVKPVAGLATSAKEDASAETDEEPCRVIEAEAFAAILSKAKVRAASDATTESADADDTDDAAELQRAPEHLRALGHSVTPSANDDTTDDRRMTQDVGIFDRPTTPEAPAFRRDIWRDAESEAPTVTDVLLRTPGLLVIPADLPHRGGQARRMERVGDSLVWGHGVNRGRGDALVIPQAGNRIDEQMRQWRIRNEKKRQLLPRLYPRQILSPIEQGPIGNCYALAALLCVKENEAEGEDLLLDLFDYPGDEEGHWRVRFFDPDLTIPQPGGFQKGDWVWIDVTEAEVNLDYSERLRKGALGDRLIERAFMTFITKKEGGEAGNTMVNIKRRDHKGRLKKRMLWEGGQPYRALYYLVGREFEKYRAIDREQKWQLLKALQEDRASGRNELMVMAASNDEDNRFFEFFKGMFYDLTGWGIALNHAYALRTVADDRVTLVNPHDSAESKAIELGDCLDDFCEIYAVRRAVKPHIANDRTRIGVPLRSR